MLQQTQVERVIKYYEDFLKKFPTTKALADAPLSEVLKLWKGLGYNRRAVYLTRTAEDIESKFDGKFPKEYSSLLSLSGIGQSTAGALMNFAFEIPTPFIETNIRSVFIYHFFRNKEKVSDKEILELVTLLTEQNRKKTREWYYALYDYGTYLKKTVGNQNHKSAHHKKQSMFKGSNRELRALILADILVHTRTTSAAIARRLGKDKSAVEKNLGAFIKEGTVMKTDSAYSIV